NPQTIPTGGSSTLTWNTTNAATVKIDNNIGTVAASGSVTVTPTTSTTYTLTATAADGVTKQTATAMVTVGAAGSATLTLTVNPASITSGQTATLTWTVSNAKFVRIHSGAGKFSGKNGVAITTGASGSTTVSPSAN